MKKKFKKFAFSIFLFTFAAILYESLFCGTTLKALLKYKKASCFTNLMPLIQSFLGMLFFSQKLLFL